MKNSLKFLVRTPLKTVLFFLLITAALTVLFTGAKIGSMTSAKIEAVESTFTTLGTVEQTNVNTFPQVTLWSQNENWLKSQDADPDSTPIEKGYFQDFWPTLLDWEELERDYLSPDLLQFEGAGYVQGPEKRPYYGAWIPELQVKQPYSGFFSVLEFTPVEDTVPGLPFLAKIDRVLFGNSPGEEAYLCDHFNPEPRSLEAGKTYIAFIPGSSVVYAHEGSDELVREFPIYPFPIYGHPNSQCPYYAEVTENFYDTQWGKVWENLVQALERKRSTYPVLPTDSLDLLPTFHKGLVSVKFGREITEEEFQAGDKVCLAPMDFLLEQELEVGDTLPVSLYYADSFFSPRVEYGDRGVVNYSCMNLLDDQYQVPDVFWEEEYEIVGAYLTTGVQNATRDESEITNGLLILPSASVGPVPAENMLDTGPMLSTTTSFIIPNGTATEYLEKFRENVPESENLEITFDDGGYSQIVANLREIQLKAAILFAIGAVVTAVISVLLLYFFIVKQAHRTAVERSLGMTKRQCFLSLVGGLMVLCVAASLGAAAINLGIGTAVEDRLAQEEQEYFSTEYSLWTREEAEAPAEVEAMEGSQFLLPIAGLSVLFLALIFALSLWLVSRSLRTDPIYIINSRE